jgi:predicted alpha/beta hydrolase
MTPEASGRDTKIPARDGYLLAATVFEPEDTPLLCILIDSAAAVPRHIYGKFASYLSTRGFLVVTFDYRGVGESRPPSLRRFMAKMRDWAEIDTAGVIDYARSNWPHLSLAFIGHSFGGQALGLLPNNKEISAAYLIAANAGTWRLIKIPERYRIYLLFGFILPAITAVVGYVPARRLGLGQDIPRGVLTEWAGWILNRHYFFDDVTLQSLANFPKFTGRLRVIGFTDDPWATEASIDLLMSGFVNVRPERRQIAPGDVGRRSVGHFGFFLPESQDLLWRDAAQWLLR